MAEGLGAAERAVKAAFAIPGDIETPTGGYGYDRRVLALLPQFGIEARHVPLPGSFPNPTVEDLARTAGLLAAIKSDEVLLIDGLAYGALPRPLLDEVCASICALVHHPLGLETGLSAGDRERLLALERDALAFARQVVVTSEATKAVLVRDFAVPAGHISVAEPGTDRADRAHGNGDPLHLLAVGAVSPRKGYDVLIEALARLAHLDWRLTIAGALDRDPASAATLRAAIDRHGLTPRVALPGSLGKCELDAAYLSADVFVLSSRYEGYGMVVGEAMARGLPIIATKAGGVIDTLQPGTVLTIAPDDVPALAEAIRRALTDPSLRRSLSDASWAAGRSLPTWGDTTRIIANALRATVA